MNKINFETFKRVEEKYVLTQEQYEKISCIINEYFSKSQYFQSTICNIYFDTDDFELARISIDKPIYKQKVRARVYKDEVGRFDVVFLEIKSKLDNVVFKRRVMMSYKEFLNYIKKNDIPRNCNKQVIDEIDYIFKKYKLLPKMYLTYNREAYFLKSDKNFRITIDKNITYRENEINFESKCFGKKISSGYIMEIKSMSSYPLWFCKVLSDCNIYPQSFSKYGRAYKDKLLNSK